MPAIFAILMAVLALTSCAEYQKPQLPIKFFINSDFPADKTKAVFEAADRWNTALPNAVIEITGITTKEYDLNDGYNMLFWSEKPHSESDLAAGTAMTAIDNNGNVLCDIEIRATNYGVCAKDSEGNYRCSDYGYNHLVYVLMHEIGHCLQLGHVDNALDLMYKSTPTKVDLNSVPTVYDIIEVIKTLDIQ